VDVALFVCVALFVWVCDSVGVWLCDDVPLRVAVELRLLDGATLEVEVAEEVRESEAVPVTVDDWDRVIVPVILDDWNRDVVRVPDEDGVEVAVELILVDEELWVLVWEVVKDCEELWGTASVCDALCVPDVDELVVMVKVGDVLWVADSDELDVNDCDALRVPDCEGDALCEELAEGCPELGTNSSTIRVSFNTAISWNSEQLSMQPSQN
jgi:hypothetical protein